ncbi:MAG: lipid-A-disaccharide synthase, partial [candidate division Zixibacteria bacterium]
FRLISILKKRREELALTGLGGERLKSLGQKQLADPEQLAVLGFWEVARHYFFFRRLMKKCEEEIRRNRPSCILLVDYPGFNLRLAKRIKDTGIPIVYYISPQVWAWGGKRVTQIAKLVDLMILNLPFEKPFFDHHKIENRLVGHYLLEDIPTDYIASEVPGSRQLGLLPGSRYQEIERMLPAMLSAARLHIKAYGGKAVVAGIRNRYDYEAAIKAFGSDAITVRYDDPRGVICQSNLVLVASGTATLETGIIGRPMVVIYKTGWLTYQIAKRLVKLDTIGLVNLVLGRKVVPELIQLEASPERMAAELSRLMTDKEQTMQISAQLKRLPDLLGGKNGSEEAALLLEAYL